MSFVKGKTHPMSFRAMKNCAAAMAVAFGLAIAAQATAVETLLSEDFEGLALKDAVSATESAGTAVWTEVAPTGWTRDNTDTPIGDPVEFQGWTFLNKEWWISTAGDQNRSTFVNGTGTVAVADPDEYDDGTDIDTGLMNVFLETPAIDLTGIQANSVTLNFASNFRSEVTQIGVLDVSYDGGANYTNVLTYDSAAIGDGTVVDEIVNLPLSNPEGGSLMVRWGMTQASNDWWWAIDNVTVTGELVPEPSSLLLCSFLGLALLAGRRRNR
jgi:hypothetical protein